MTESCVDVAHFGSRKRVAHIDDLASPCLPLGDLEPRSRTTAGASNMASLLFRVHKGPFSIIPARGGGFDRLGDQVSVRASKLDLDRTPITQVTRCIPGTGSLVGNGTTPKLPANICNARYLARQWGTANASQFA